MKLLILTASVLLSITIIPDGSYIGGDTLSLPSDSFYIGKITYA